MSAVSARECPLLPAEPADKNATLLKVPTHIIEELQKVGPDQLTVTKGADGVYYVALGEGSSEKVYAFRQERGVKPAFLVEDNGERFQVLKRVGTRYAPDFTISQSQLAKVRSAVASSGSDRAMNLGGTKRAGVPSLNPDASGNAAKRTNFGTLSTAGSATKTNGNVKKKQKQVPRFTLNKVIGWLSLEPLTYQQVESNVQMRDILYLVEMVAELGRDGRYYIKLDDLKNFDVTDVDIFTEEESQRVRLHVQMANRGEYPFDKGANGKSADDDTSPEIKHLFVEDEGNGGHESAKKPNGDILDGIGETNSVPTDLHAPGGRDFVGNEGAMKEWPQVKNWKEYEKYCEDFKRLYSEYLQADGELTRGTRAFEILGKRLESANSDADKRTIEAQITSLYKEKGADVMSAQERYRGLHEKLKVIKHRVKVFASTFPEKFK